MGRLILWMAFLTCAPGRMLAQLLQIDQHADLSGNWPYGISTNAPMGQTFTPSSNRVGFVQLKMSSGGPSVMHLNLRSGSVTGPVIARSRTLKVPSGSQLPLLFDFGTNVAVNPGQLYAAEPIIDSGADCSLVIYHFSYAGGEAILRGAPLSSVADMWFREGPVANFPQFTAVPVAETAGRFQATLAGLAGEQAVIEISSNTVNWLPYQTNVFTNSIVELNFSNVVSPTFYRASYLIP